MSLLARLQSLGLAAFLSLALAGAVSAAPSGGIGLDLGAAGTMADGGAVPATQAGEAPMRVAQANCSGAAAQAAAQTGGQVLSVSSREQNGRVVCVVTVLVPGQDGGRPRRTTITLPG